MESHTTFGDALDKLQCQSRPTIKRKSTTTIHDPAVKRRRYDFGHAPKLDRNDDVNDSLKWSCWPPLRRAKTRTPQFYDADNTSDEEDNPGKIKDEDEPSVGTESNPHNPHYTGYPTPLHPGQESPNYQDLASQLSEEVYTLKRNSPAYRNTSTTSASCDDDDEEKTLVSSPVSNGTDWSAQSKTRREDPWCIAHKGRLLKHGFDQIERSGQSANTGLGFELRFFRMVFEEARWRERMNEVRMRMGALSLREEDET
ncbi:hypothetical protein NX059_009438 [Plenodomus lindquistii]|nr:hypothetical protein NX059_009438 [Plenodomus lindquistii]